MLAIKEKITMRGVYHPIINLVNISHLRVLDHFKDKETSLGELHLSSKLNRSKYRIYIELN